MAALRFLPDFPQAPFADAAIVVKNAFKFFAPSPLCARCVKFPTFSCKNPIFSASLKIFQKVVDYLV
jgi:hypothetical protein